MLTTDPQIILVALGILIFLAASSEGSLGIHMASFSSLPILEHANNRPISHHGSCRLLLREMLYLGTCIYMYFRSTAKDSWPQSTYSACDPNTEKQISLGTNDNNTSLRQGGKERANQNMLWGQSQMLLRTLLSQVGVSSGEAQDGRFRSQSSCWW